MNLLSFCSAHHFERLAFYTNQHVTQSHQLETVLFDFQSTSIDCVNNFPKDYVWVVRVDPTLQGTQVPTMVNDALDFKKHF